MIGAQILVREYNNYSDTLKGKLKPLEPGEVVKIILNPTLWGSVKETQFASMDSNAPIAGRVNMVTKRVATRWLPSPWNVNDGGKIIQVGFMQGYNSVDNTPIWRDRFFEDGEMVFNGSNPVDVEDFYAIQLHPEMKKEGSRSWKFYLDDPDESADNSMKKITWRTAIQNAVLGVSDAQLKRVAQPMEYNRSLLNKPTHNSPKAMRGYLASLLNSDAGYSLVENIFRNLSEIEDIDLIVDAINTGKLILSETNLKRNDNHLLGSFTTPIRGNSEEKAIEIYGLFKSNPEWKQDILEWLREDSRKTPNPKKPKTSSSVED